MSTTEFAVRSYSVRSGRVAEIEAATLAACLAQVDCSAPAELLIGHCEWAMSRSLTSHEQTLVRMIRSHRLHNA